MAQQDSELSATNRSSTTDYLGIALLLLLWGISIYSYFNLPDTIPVHFNERGEADGYGGKSFLWLLPAIGTTTFIGLTFLSRYPQHFNYPVKITDENRDRQYGNAVELIRNLKLVTIAIFTMVNLMIYLTGSGIIKSPGIWLLPVILALVFIPTGIFIFHAVRKARG
jgi:uncharacterized membrane protein